MVKMLISTGSVDINRGADGFGSPMALAASHGHTEVVRELLRAGWMEERAIRRSDERSPLQIAVEYQHADVVALLVEPGGADPDVVQIYDRESPIFSAARKGNIPIMRILLGSGWVDVNRKAASWRAPLAYAARHGHAEAVKLLLASGADPCSCDANGRTPLCEAALARVNERNTVIELLLVSGDVDVDSNRYDWGTPLALAAACGYTDGLRTLLHSGKANPTVRDTCGRTPLHHAAMVRYQAPDHPGFDGNPAAMASTTGVLVKQLLRSSKRYDSGVQDCDRRTPLWYATFNNWLAIGELLMERGNKEVNVKDDGGQSPLDGALQEGREDFVKLLQRIQ